MKLIVAVPNANTGGDFDHGVLDGELVGLGPVCDLDALHPEQGCGCGRAFTGLVSGQATTTGRIAQVDITRGALEAGVYRCWIETWRSFGRDEAECREWAAQQAGDLIRMVRDAPVGVAVHRYTCAGEQGVCRA